MNRTESRSPALLPPVTLAPEEAAAVAVALAAQPDGPFAPAGREALEKVLAALEPDPRLRAELRAELRAAGRKAGAGRPSGEPGSRSRHPAGRARRPHEEAPQRPRLVVLPGGQA